MDDDDSFRFRREGVKKDGERTVEVDGGSGESGNKVGGKFVDGGRVWRRRREWGYVKVMELNRVTMTTVTIVVTAINATKPSLAVVGGGANEVDGDMKGREEAREVEELVQMALCW